MDVKLANLALWVKRKYEATGIAAQVWRELIDRYGHLCDEETRQELAEYLFNLSEPDTGTQCPSCGEEFETSYYAVPLEEEQVFYCPACGELFTETKEEILRRFRRIWGEELKPETVEA